MKLVQDKVTRYWRVSDQFADHTIIEADAYTVDDRGNLIFTNDNSNPWTPHHTVNKHFWRAVTECDIDGHALWSRDVHDEVLSVRSDISSADIESLANYIEHVTESAIRKATED